MLVNRGELSQCLIGQALIRDFSANDKEPGSLHGPPGCLDQTCMI